MPRSRLNEYREGLNGGEVTGRWGALGRNLREARLQRRAALRAWTPPEEEIEAPEAVQGPLSAPESEPVEDIEE